MSNDEYQHQNTFKNMKRAIVIQGGGSYGAYTAGRICRRKLNYDAAVGSSTGALIAPFALLGQYSVLETGYTTIGNKEIYSRTPFWGDGIPKVYLALWSWIRQKKGITDSKPLRKLIGQLYTQKMHESIPALGKKLYVTGCNLNSNVTPSKYYDSAAYTWEQYCDLIWASTLVPGLLEPYHSDLPIFKGIDMVDGGTTENVGMRVITNKNYDFVDIYLHNTIKYGMKEEGKNWIHNLIRALIIQREEVINDDLYSNLDGINHKIHYLPKPLEGAGAMDFQPKVMRKWFDQGFHANVDS
jgi:predicted patatin/cPLA2 family phospholipase